MPLWRLIEQGILLTIFALTLLGEQSTAAKQILLQSSQTGREAAWCHKGWCHGENINTATSQWKTRTPKDDPHRRTIVPYNGILLPLRFESLPLGAVRPLGWLRQQLDLMVDGLPGHLHDFYRPITNATWLGGNEEYSWLNEAWPYHYNALVPLAWTTNNARLKHHVLQVTDFVIGHQHEDGWLGPEDDLARRNFWGRYPFFLGLTQLVEAEPELGEAMILPAMHRFVHLMYSMLQNNHQGYVWKPGDIFDDQWGRSRAADIVLVLQWLYEKHPLDNEEELHYCMVQLYEMAYDWSYWFNEEQYLKDDLDLYPDELTRSLFPYVHGVNAGQGLKWGAVMRRLVHDDKYMNTTRNGIDWTFRYHGTPSGAIIGDERLSGLSPLRGTELCSVVESMYSLNYLYQSLGDRDFADKSEQTAYNALPVMLMPHWWAHQYIAQTNQPISHQLDSSPFWNVGPMGQTYGTEPNFPCCTVNMQGYAKFVPAMFVKDGKDGLAHALLGPAHVTVTLAKRNQVRVRCRTNYPFSNYLDYEIKANQAFRFSFRVPSWVLLEASFVVVDGGKHHVLKPDNATGLHGMIIPAGRTRVEVSYAAELRVEERANNTVSIYHGALLYALPVAGEYIATRPANYPGTQAPPEAHDWTILPTQPWNMAIDTTTLKFYEYDNRYADELPHPIWHEGRPPVSISALGCQIDWEMKDGYAPNPPPVGMRNCTGRAFPVELRPYGSAKLHMAELPTVNLRPRSPDLWQSEARVPGSLVG